MGGQLRVGEARHRIADGGKRGHAYEAALAERADESHDPIVGRPAGVDARRAV
jgi:hypothetical protein